MSRSSLLLLRIAVATLLGFGGMLAATELDPRFTPIFAFWLSASAARVPYVTAGADTLLAGALAGASFVLLSLGRGRRSAYGLAALAVGVAAFTCARIGGPEARSCQRRSEELAAVPRATADDPAETRCGGSSVTRVAAGELTTRITCTSRDAARAATVDVRERRDDLVVAEAGRTLLLQRVCLTEGTRTTCRWRAGPAPEGAPRTAAAGALADVGSLARPANADDALAVDWLPDFGAFRVRDPEGELWDFDGRSGREMLGPILEGHLPLGHALGRLALVVSLAGSAAAIAFLVLMEQRLRREKRFAGARTGTVSRQVVTFTDGSSARVIDGSPLEGAVTTVDTAAAKPADAAASAVYRDDELLRAADLARGAARDLAGSQQRKAAILRAMLLAVVALTVVPVTVAWFRSTTPLPPLPLAPLDPPLVERP